MSDIVKRIGRLGGWILTSIIATFGLLFIISIIFEEIVRIYSIPFEPILILSGLVSFAVTRRFFYGSYYHGGSNGWQPPSTIREKIIGMPQFKGRLDRNKGLLEATARMVTPDMSGQQFDMLNRPIYYTIYRLRAELLDEQGSPREYVPVEIKADQNKWVGTLVDGDRFRVEGKFGKDGILHAKRAFNFSTNSIVGEK